ncbi:hypothetical protein G7Y89_g4566 [Cudoniella acicularis]|uniref:Uncharacterized protein n=1 Tax=Cudoniella acicularis TaxID=354080 RepID=A0A8H4W7B8_9HELO|nr:hypothetical protein G7Y89_g4566 [Cudoniella acicularis]
MSSLVLPVNAWTRARDRFIEDLSAEEKILYSNASLENVFYSASAAQRNHQMNSTTRKVADQLQPLVAAIDQYGGALDIYSNASSVIMSLLWGSLRLAKEFGKYFDKLVDMFVRISDVLPRFRVYERLFPSHEPLIHALSVVYVDILRFSTEAKAVFRKAKRPSVTNLHIATKLLWKPFDRQFGTVMDDFRQHRNNVEKEANLSHMLEAKDAREIERINRMEMEKQRKRDDRIRLLSLLPSINSSVIDAWSSEVEYRGFATAYHYCDYSDQMTLDALSILGSLVQQLLLTAPMSYDLEAKLWGIYGSGVTSPTREEVLEILCSLVGLYPQTFIAIDGLDECGKEAQEDILFTTKRLASLDHSVIKVYISSREDARISAAMGDHSRICLSEAMLACDINSYIKHTVSTKIQARELAIRNPVLEKEIVSELSNKAHGMFLWVYFKLEEICDASQSDEGIRETLRNLPDGLTKTYGRILMKIEKKPPRSIRMAEKILKWVVSAKRPLLLAELKEAIAFEPKDKFWNSEKIPEDPDGKGLLQTCANLVLCNEDGTVQLAHHTVQQFLVTTPRVESPQRLHFTSSQADLHITSSTYIHGLEAKGVLGPGGMAQLPSLLGIGHQLLNLPYRVWRRRIQSEPEDVNYSQFLNPSFHQSGVGTLPKLKEKYRLLEYVVENWAWHTKALSKESQVWQSFRNLALDRQLAFRFRNWDESVGTHYLPFLPLYRWAVEADHAPLLQLLLVPTQGPELSSYRSDQDANGYLGTIKAARRGRTAILKFFLELNKKEVDGMILGPVIPDHDLMVEAAANGHLSTVELLLEKSVSVNAVGVSELPEAQRSRTPWTSLSAATHHGHYEVIRLLLDEGANPNVEYSMPSFIPEKVGHLNATQADGENSVHTKSLFSCYTPLLRATEIENTEVLQLLLHRGANANALAGENGLTPLMLAAKNGYTIGVKTLLDHLGTNGHSDVVRQLLSKKGVSLNFSTGNLPLLFQAIQKRHMATFKLLLEYRGTNINFDNDAGDTVLLWAVRNWQKSDDEGYLFIKLLLEHKSINVNYESPDGSTPLILAIQSWDARLAQMILQHEAVDVNSRNTKGSNPLSEAVNWLSKIYESTDIVRMILDRDGIDINQRDGNGNTALMNAVCHNKSVGIAKLLLRKYNVDLMCQNRHGETALSLAAEAGHCRIVELILERDGIDINHQDKKGDTALTKACQYGHHGMVRLLLKQDGIDVNHRNVNGDTALAKASSCRHPKIVKLLLQKDGINVLPRNNGGDTYAQKPLLIVNASIAKGSWYNDNVGLLHEARAKLEQYYCCSERPCETTDPEFSSWKVDDSVVPELFSEIGKWETHLRAHGRTSGVIDQICARGVDTVYWDGIDGCENRKVYLKALAISMSWEPTDFQILALLAESTISPLQGIGSASTTASTGSGARSVSITPSQTSPNNTTTSSNSGSTSPTTTPGTPSSSLTSGAKAGIAIGVLIIATTLLLSIFLFFRHRGNRLSQAARNANVDVDADGDREK